VDDRSSTLERLAWHVAAALESLQGALSSEDAFADFVRDELGLDVPEGFRAIGIDAGAVDGVISALDEFTSAIEADEPDRAAIALRSAALVAAVASAVRNLADVGRRAAEGQDPAFATASAIVQELPRRLLDWIVVQQIEATSIIALDSLRVLGVVEVEDVSADPDTFTTAHVHRAIRLDRLATLLTDPARWLEVTYGWGAERAALDRLLERLFLLAVALGIPAGLSGADLQRAETLAGQSIDPETEPVPVELRLPFFSLETTGAEFDAGLGLMVLPAKGGSRQGLALLPFADGVLEASIPLDLLGVWTLAVTSTLDLQGGIGVAKRPGEEPRLLTGIDDEGAGASGRLEIRLTRDPSADPVSLVRFGNDSGVIVTSVEVRAAARLDADRPTELVLEAAVKQALLRVRMGEADGFLRSVVPDLDLAFDAGFGFSTLHGSYFVGGAALEATYPANRRIGPVQIRRLTLGLRSSGDDEPAGLTVLAGLGVALSIGPVNVVVDGVGARLRLEQEAGGNLGPVDLSVGFKPPTGLGLELRSGPVNGGGFLFHDEAREQYAGAMELRGFGITVKALGVVTTRMPNGAPGFSMLVVVSTEFTPVQLGLGFRLEGVGGIVGINRTVAIETLRSGLKTGSLAAVLSPPDPVGNAAQLISTLAGVFPPAAGRHVFGPTARIVWGSLSLVTIDLGLALEVPSPTRLIVLGRLRALIPDARAPIVRLQMDMIGVVDVDRDEAAVDATLVDSRIAEFALTGDMALRVNWGTNASFLLAVGGFHPRFTAPAGFPALKRVAIALSSGDNPKLRLDAYLALTSNTLQFGARLDLAVKSGRFTVAGFLSFDALVTLAPLGFTIDIAGRLAVRAGGHTILSVSLSLSLSGPQPWHARGKASFSLLFFDVTFRFDVTIGDRRPPAVPERIDVAAMLRAAFVDRRAWAAQLPAGGDAVVTLRAIRTEDVLAHPLGTLQVRQRVAPLERTLERFGAHVPSGANTFRISGATIGGATADLSPLEDLFAPGQFRALTDDQKLALPSFEAMRSGATLGAPALAHGRAVAVTTMYEQRIITAEGVTLPPPERSEMPDRVFAALPADGEEAVAAAFVMRSLS
jgi:hypothetical protein